MTDSDRTASSESPRKGNPAKLVIIGIIVLTLLVAAYTQLGIIVVQPIGSVPDGRTVVIWRRSANLNFIDSADAVCDRSKAGVSLFCRGVVLAAIVKTNPILLRLPYSKVLYDLSTGGKEYER
ncbi:hypothetical protein FHR90_002398 [Endobacter medicaginis]|uniref:Uncharacterized protein n=1 Tax=Endobacter medicaginis TaxID=1181271 RepID=A0A850NMR0_9PROT|nr:hypothetical protein [Endobacter medicaginis]MBB3174553.1 hypothetical protein [Endobacter medicaginis]MCX5474754.1 hypothetical protein [Endobacter medicaginis]NVN29176.1 hypothetical protein [Endobacter medicaginis]